MFNCPHCQKELQDDANFCSGCGQKLDQKCPSCGRIMASDALFCKDCGTNLKEQQASIPSQVENFEEEDKETNELITQEKHLDGEKKFITSCFIKLVKTGERAQNQMVVDSLIKKTIESFGGCYLKHTGTTTFAFFGAPIACEDHPLRACLAAYTLREQLIEKRWQLDIRIGIHSGEAVFVKLPENDESQMKYDVFGSSVNLAARMMQTAPSDHIQLTADTYSLVKHVTQTIPLGEKFVKEGSKAVMTYALVGVDRESIHSQLEENFYGGSRFYGRENEVKLFLLALSQAKQNHGSLLAFKAEPGIGKTRLMYEFSRNALRTDFFCYSVRSYANEHIDSYSTLRKFIRSLLSFGSNLPKPMHFSRLANAIRGLPFSEEFALASILSILGGSVEDEQWRGLDPILKLEILFQSLLEYIEFQSQLNPVVLIFEDLQWCDKDSLKFIHFLSSRIKESKIIILLDYRPEMQLPENILEVGTEIELSPLSEVDCKKIISDLLPGKRELQKLRERILSTSGGNPFYIEEYVKAVISNGAVVKDEKGYTLVKDYKENMLPQTLQGLISNRINQLSHDDKVLLQQASIFGGNFKSSFLRYVSKLDSETFRLSLTLLEKKGFIVQTQLFPEPEFTFKHIYICDVAYGMMLTKTRKSYHTLLVDEIEKNEPESIAENYSILAKHACYGELWRKALHYINLLMPDSVTFNFPVSQYLSYGPQAKLAYQNLSDSEEKHEAFEEYGRTTCLWLHALLVTGRTEDLHKEIKDFVQATKEQNNEIFELEGHAWEVSADVFAGHASQAYEKAKKILPKLDVLLPDDSGSDASLIKHSILLWILQSMMPIGKYDEFDKISEKILHSSHEYAASHYSIGVAAKAAGYLNTIFCNFLRGRASFLEDKISYLDEQIKTLPDAEPRLLARIGVVTYYYLIGNFDYTRSLLTDALSLVKSLQVKFLEAVLQAISSSTNYYRDDITQALENARLSIATNREANWVYSTFAGCIAAESLSLCGAYDEALGVLDELLGIAESDNQKPLIAQCLRIKALTYNLMAKDRRWDDEILKLLDKAEEITEEVGCHLQRPFIYLNYAQYYQRVGEDEKAHAHHEKALKCFEENGMSGWYDHYLDKEIYL